MRNFVGAFSLDHQDQLAAFSQPSKWRVWWPGGRSTLVILGLAIALTAVGTPNLLWHWWPASCVGIGLLLAVLWRQSWGLQLRCSYLVWLVYFCLVFLPDFYSVRDLASWYEVLGGILVAPFLPLLFTAFTVLALQGSAWVPEWGRPLAIATIWTGLDGFQGVLQSPFVFPVGACWYNFALGIQVAELTGVWGVTFLVILVNGLVAALLQPVGWRWFPRIAPRPVSGHQSPLGTLGRLNGGILFLVGIFSVWQLRAWLPASAEQGYVLGAIQPLAWVEGERDWTYRAARYADISRLTEEAIAQGASLVAWPEGALRAQVIGTSLESYIFDPLLPQLPPNGGIITGSTEIFPGDEDLPPTEARYLNAALLYQPEVGLADQYGKQWIFPYFESGRGLVPSADGYRPLAGGPTLGPLGVMICLESTLPLTARELTREGAESLLVISEDVWFGRSNWPRLHAVLSVFRAVENRRSFAFINNTGNNLIIAPSGQIEAEGPFWEPAAVVGPMSRQTVSTLANRWGDWWAIATALASAGLGAGAVITRVRKKYSEIKE